MTETLDGRVALVTGAGRGIGLEIARTLSSLGARLVVLDHSAGSCEAAGSELAAAGREVLALAGDVSREEDVERAVRDAVNRFGRLDILVNNAGLQHVAPIEDFPTEVFERMLRVMVVGPFLGIKHASPIMKAQGRGRIVSIASINGLIGFPGKSAYNASKHAVIGLTKVAALELAAHGVTVNALCPGYVDTPMVRGQLRDLAAMRGISEDEVLERVIYPLVPQRRLLSTGEVAAYVAFLASDAARGVTGQAVVMDGGYTTQ